MNDYVSAKLADLKKLANPKFYIKENIVEPYYNPYDYEEEYKNNYFQDLWKNEYNDILIDIMYFCSSHSQKYTFDIFYTIFEELSLDYYSYWYIKKSSKKIKEYFLNNKNEIFNPEYEKYPKNWKTVFYELPPSLKVINNRFSWDLSDFLNYKIHQLILENKIKMVQRERISKVSGDIFYDHKYTGVFYKIKHKGFPEWELQQYEIEISNFEFDLFRRMGTSEEVRASIKYLRQMLDLIGFIPDFNLNLYYTYKNIPKEKYFEFINIQKNIFYPYFYNDLYGGWMETVKQTGFFGNNEIKRNSFGYSVFAKDGDICYSLAEKIIDDWFFNNNIKHLKETDYPKCVKKLLEKNIKADWLINDIFIEYFGLQSIKKYSEKTEMKILACKMNNVKLIALYPGDEYKLDEIFGFLKYQ
jgi:hypothetical protein